MPTALPICTTPGVSDGKRLEPGYLDHALAAFTPENALIVNKAATTRPVWSAVHAASAAPHTSLHVAIWKQGNVGAVN